VVLFIPIRLRNQIWDKYHFSGTQLSTVAASRQGPRIHHAPSSYTDFNEYMPQGQRTLTEVDGVVAGDRPPVGPATQKEVAPAQANTSRKRDAAEVAAQPAGGFFGWMGREQLGAGRRDGTSIPCSHYPHGSSGPLRLAREGECPGTVAFISCLDSKIDDLVVIL
jgi:hypothetical protein